MTTRVAARTVAAFATAVVVGGLSVLLAAPAQAAEPGDAAAVGAVASLQVDIGPFQFEASNALGGVEVSNPGQDAVSLSDQTLVDLALASITIDSIETAAESTATVAQAATEVGGTSANLFGLSIVSLDTAEAAVTCPLDGAPEAIAGTTGLRILGIPVILTGDEPVSSQTAPLPAAVPTPDPDDGDATVDLSGLDVTVSVTQGSTTDDTGAASVALVAAIVIDGSLGEQTFDAQAIGSIVLAAATCQKPLPPVAPFAVTAISPATGSTVGGETVTITGSGFTSATTVSFGSAAATNVVVDPSGESLTAVTPASAAGAVTVTVTEGEQSGTLGYTYVLPAPTPTPTPVPVPAGTGGTTSLAATGAEPAPLLAAGAAAVALGLLLSAAALVRRRRAA